VRSRVPRDILIAGDRIARLLVDEEKFLFDADRGMSGHGLKIDPARRSSSRRTGSRWKSLVGWCRGSPEIEVGGRMMPTADTR
jgi:hypothetical protein